MRHQNRIKRLGRAREHRKSLFRNQVISLLQQGMIKTTLRKAKETSKYAEKMITLGKKADLTSRRVAHRFLTTREMTNKLFEEIAPLFKDRNGGYTRIYKLGKRRGDNAEMAMLQLTELPRKEEEPSEKKEKKKGFLGLKKGK